MPTPGQLTNRPTSGIDKLQQVPKNSSAQIFETIGFPRPRRDLCVRDLPFEKPPGGSVRLLVQFRPNGCVRGPHCLGAGALFQHPINLNLSVQHDLDDRQQHIHTLRQYVCLHQVPSLTSAVPSLERTGEREHEEEILQALACHHQPRTSLRC